MKTFRERCSPIHHLFDYYNLQVAEFASLPRIEFEQKKKKKLLNLPLGDWVRSSSWALYHSKTQQSTGHENGWLDLAGQITHAIKKGTIFE
jgi:hypothetical protein